MANWSELFADAINKGIDPYIYIASLFYKIPTDEVTKEQRVYIKNQSFLIFYDWNKSKLDDGLIKLIEEYKSSD